MNKVFHQLAPVIALDMMPKEFKDFMLSNEGDLEKLKVNADLPDMVDKDNLVQDADIHHAHSYKLQEVDNYMKWIDGDALERLKGLCADAHDFKAEKNIEMVKYCLGKMTHYRIDALTYPHLHRGKPWNLYHEKFETQMGKFLYDNQDKIGSITFEPYKDVYKDCRTTAIDMWHKALIAVEKYESKEDLPYEEKLDICRTCIKGVGDLWLTLAKELKLI